MDRLERGDLLPHMATDVPGPEAMRLSTAIRRVEAPGINTLYRDQPNIFWRQAVGSNILDVDGNRYIDLTSGFGVAAIGHRHPAVVKAIRSQSEILIHGLGDAIGHPLRIDLATRLAELSPIPETRTYFAISGADAVEIAIKTALLSHGGRRNRILAFEPSYHGLTFGAMNLSSRPYFKAPFSGHLISEVHRLAFGCPIKSIHALIRRHDGIAAMVVEPIVGREGVILPPHGWLEELASVCRKHGVLIIVDEIFTGFGRTGYRFAVDYDPMVPDLICCGKALAGGMPIAAVLGSEQHMSCWKTSGEAIHTATFVANPVACAAACSTLDVLVSEQLPQRAARLGNLIAQRTQHWSDRFDIVHAVRGRGLLWGVELNNAEAGSRLAHESRRRGILLLVGGPEGRVAQIVPPLTIDESQLDHSLTVLETNLQRLETDPSES